MKAQKIQMDEHRQTIISALRAQVEAVAAIEANIDNNFDAIVELLYSTTGKIVVSGMGKSGFIARKFSATLSSTGTPSVFMHPSEALHGDLGMLARNDTLILLSNSGNTAEIKFIIEYCKLHGVAVIGITRNSDSSLVKMSDHSFVLQNLPEMTAIGAPTTSSTMMLVLCDLLALALIEMKEFDKTSYKKLHPGGAIGSNLLTLKDVMHKDHELPVVRRDQNIASAILEITQKRLGCVGVVDNDELLGIITDYDLRRHIDCDIHSTKVEEIMNASPHCFDHTEYLVDVIAVMNHKKITNAFVMNSGKLCGVVHIHDLLARLI